MKACANEPKPPRVTPPEPESDDVPAAAWLEAESLLKKLLRSKDSTIVSEFGGKRIVREPVPITKEEPLKLELEHFIECVRAHRIPDVSGESAKKALDLAFEITRQIRNDGSQI